MESKVPWRIEFDDEKHSYHIVGDGISLKPLSVTRILKMVGIVNLDHINKDLLERAANFGTALHSTTELYDKGILDIESLDSNEKTKELRPYLDQWIKFRELYQPEIVAIELPVGSVKHGYAGKIDRIIRIGKQVILLDIKTSASLYQSVSIQEMAYKMAFNEMQFVDGDKPVRILQRWCVRILEDSFKVDKFDNDSHDQDIFLSALKIAKFIKGE